MGSADAFDSVLDRLTVAQRNETSAKAFCPSHDDQDPSLSLRMGDDGRVLLRCHAGCDPQDVVAAIGLEMSDLFVRHSDRNGSRNRNKFDRKHPNEAASAQGCTLEEYAEAKQLPVDFLREFGLTERSYQGKPAVRIPYRDVDGVETAVRYRTALTKTGEGADNRFRWTSGSKTTLYGLERLNRIKEAGYVVLVEGESDTQTLTYKGIPALGIPGANNYKEDWSAHLDDLETVYVVVEPDKGGEALKEKLAASGIRERLHLVDLGEHEDASSLYLAAPEGFEKNFVAALEAAIPWTELRRTEIEAEARGAWECCKDLAQDPHILERFVEELSRSGVAGESKVATLTYLAVTSRLLERPVSIAVKGPSSAGKSYMTEQVLRFFPESAYYALTAMSERALAYGEEPLSHRFLVLYEAAGMSGDFQTYLIRSLLSEGRIRYETVEKTSEGMRPRLIEREGPTGLIVTTTAVKLHPENETRLLSVGVADTQEQTRQVMASLASETGRYEPDLGIWHALQTWLASSEHCVTIPYANVLAQLVPAVAVRLRRDFGALLNLIRTHAVLQQASRDRDAEGRIIADVEDYAVVRELVADLVSEGIEATVPDTVRETVEALKQLVEDEEGDSVSLGTLAQELDLDKSSASRRLREAMNRGYAKNLEDRRGKPGRYVLADPMPEDVEILPSAERVLQCCSANGEDKENIFTASPPEPQQKYRSTPSDNGATVQRYDGQPERERFVV